VTAPGPVGGCACTPAWPNLVVHTETGDITVEPAATPGGLACLYQARCVHCGTIYPGPFRIPPRVSTSTTCRVVRSASTAPLWSNHVHTTDPWADGAPRSDQCS
jgi:hypothetical protein